MKDQVRVLGISSGDARIRLNKKRFIGIVYRGWRCVEGIIKGSISTNSNDASEIIADTIIQSPFNKQIRCLFLDRLGITEGNKVNLLELYRLLRIPVIIVTKRRIFECLNRGYFTGEYTRHKGSIKFYGIGLNEVSAKNIIKKTSTSRQLPEALIVAKKIATACNLYLKNFS